MMMIFKQKIVEWHGLHGCYLNAWQSGTYGSINSYLEDGWLIKHFRDDKEREFLWILFEK